MSRKLPPPRIPTATPASAVDAVAERRRLQDDARFEGAVAVLDEAQAAMERALDEADSADVAFKGAMEAYLEARLRAQSLGVIFGPMESELSLCDDGE